jgi:hypothetical protein
MSKAVPHPRRRPRKRARKKPFRRWQAQLPLLIVAIALIGAGPVRCIDEGERSYDRIVAVCYGEDGEDLAAAMVRDGWATDWARYSGGRYAALEADAVRAGRGMH